MYSVLDPSRHTASASTCCSVFLFIFCSVEIPVSCLWLCHFILLHFYLLLTLPFLKGREHLNAWTISLSWPEILWSHFRIPSQPPIHSTKKTLNTFCYSLITHLLPRRPAICGQYPTFYRNYSQKSHWRSLHPPLQLMYPPTFEPL